MKKYLNIRFFMFAAVFAGIVIFLTAKSAIHEIEAFVWFELAARAGDVEAAKNRTIASNRIGPSGIATAQTKIEALSRAIIARTKNP